VLDYLHNEGVAHRDLKPENVQITMNGWLKLLDFGQAKDNLHSRISYKTGKVGTISHNAPEQFDPMGNDRGNVNSKADYWSLDVMIY
jgi:serine/threonine protein kinase